ncbi:MAG TPA: formate/nitrite transporter family protein [Nitrospiraceae bacterium]|nr:formate/nitrite transporter family protein [Nitrospiraceae bacterium]
MTDKILAIVFQITAFVPCGFEYSVANMYFLPIGVALAGGPRRYSQSLAQPAISRW